MPVNSGPSISALLENSHFSALRAVCKRDANVEFGRIPAQARGRAIRYNNAAWRYAPGGIIPLLSLARLRRKAKQNHEISRNHPAFYKK
jgi:hypothetical protein